MQLFILTCRQTLWISLHFELVYNEHDFALAIARIDGPFACSIREVFVRMVRRSNVASASSHVLHAT